MARNGNERAWTEWPRAESVAAVTLAILMTGAGVVLLYAGGEVLILGAVKLGQRARLSPLVIGLTVVAFGTSTPELAVSVEAALFGHDDVAVANVIGSNITNIALILGLTAGLTPLSSSGVSLSVMLIMIALSVLLWVFAHSGNVLSRTEGGVLLGGYVRFNAWILST